MGPVDALKIAAIEAGNLDASLVRIDGKILAQKKGMNVLIRINVIIDPAAFSGLGVNEKRLRGREKRDEVKRMIRATLKAFIFVKGNKKESVDFMVKEFGYNSKDAPAIYDMGLDTLSKDGSVPDEALEQQIEIARKSGGDIKGSVSISQLADFSILREVHKKLGLK